MHNDVTAHNKAIAFWLLTCCGLVFAMVVLGGVTRLTGSGLSMVDWRPLLGWLPPLSDGEWQRVFEMYQQSPEFQKLNSQMDISAFRTIFWPEYLHRLLGRIIGIVFLIPFIYFLVRGYIRRSEWPKYLLMFVLGGMQGVLGWYMVKSGLVDVPHVSQYRLTAHLVAAFLIYAYMFWVAMSRLYPWVTSNSTAARAACKSSLANLPMARPWTGSTETTRKTNGLSAVTSGCEAPGETMGTPD